MSSTDLIVIESRSRAANSASSSDFRLTLAEPLVGTYELVAASMTNNLYNVVTGENDSIYFTHSVDGVFVAVLAPGRYEVADLEAEVKVSMDAVGTATYTATHDAMTGKLTVVPSSGTVSLTFFTGLLQTARYLMGFAQVDTPTAASITGAHPVDLKLHDMLVVKILQDGNAHVTLPSGTEGSFMLPMDQPLFGEVYHFSRNAHFGQTALFSNSVSTIDVEVLASDGDSVDLNGVEWSMSLKKLF